MAGSDWVAGVMGAFDGGLQGYGAVQQRKRQQQLDEDEKARRAAELALRQQAAMDDRDDGLRRNYGQALDRATPTSVVAPGDASQMQRLGLGGRLEDEMTLGATRYEGLLGLPGTSSGTLAPVHRPSTPTGHTLVAETYDQRSKRVQGERAQREAREKAEREAQAAKEQEAALARFRANNPHMGDELDYGKATGRYSTYSEIPLTAEQEAAQEAGAAHAKNREWDRRNAITHGQQRALIGERADAAQQRAAGSNTAAQGVFQRTFESTLRSLARENFGEITDEMLDQAEQAAARATERFRAGRGVLNIPLMPTHRRDAGRSPTAPTAAPKVRFPVPTRQDRTPTAAGAPVRQALERAVQEAETTTDPTRRRLLQQQIKGYLTELEGAR